MLWGRISGITVAMASVLLVGMATAQAPVMPDAVADEQSERELLKLINQDRARAGVESLKIEEGLTRAAREHAAGMARQGTLTHLLPDEEGLAARVAGRSEVRLTKIGENVARGRTIEGAEEELLESPPHRANLLSPEFNVVGLGVIRKDGEFWVTQVFGSGSAPISDTEATARVIAAIRQSRSGDGLAAVAAANDRGLHDTACQMAGEDQLEGRLVPVGSGREFHVSYIATRPEMLPESALHVIGNPAVRSCGVGVCSARTATYPSGASWVVLRFY
jgi:uncharacterized protein YkwD